MSALTDILKEMTYRADMLESLELTEAEKSMIADIRSAITAEQGLMRAEELLDTLEHTHNIH